MFPAEKMAEGYALAFFVEMDTNEDGEITEEEFVEGCLNNEIISDLLVNPFTDLDVENPSIAAFCGKPLKAMQNSP